MCLNALRKNGISGRARGQMIYDNSLYSSNLVLVSLFSDWIGTLSFCISLCCAPLSVQIIRIIGHNGYRIVGYAGTIVLTISCMGSSFVTSLEWMFLTHSLLYGIGSSLLYMASSLVIGEYFDKDHKYHVLATSILLCGYPVGKYTCNEWSTMANT